MEVEFSVDELQHYVITLVAIGEEHETICLHRSEAQLQSIVIRLDVLASSTNVVRDSAVTIERDTCRILKWHKQLCDVC